MPSTTAQSLGEPLDLVVIGGGVMGRFAAYHASALPRRVAVLERGRVGDPTTASYGRTRSYRNDYLDATYARLAHEALDLWTAFERATGAEVLVRCGCMNLGKASVSPHLEDTYAEQSHAVLERLGMRTRSLDREELRRRFPYLDADIARIDLDAGVVNLPAVTATLGDTLEARGVPTLEGVQTSAIHTVPEGFRVVTDAGDFVTRSLVIAAGHGTNEVLAMLPGCDLQVPITKDRPSDAKYLSPPAATRDRFKAGVMPVIAYLDTGIYCHPIVDGLVDEVKVGFYNPPDMPLGSTSIDSIASFIEQCMPGLRDAGVRDVEDVDGCDYDLVADDDFVLGPVPGVANAFVGVGWRGTGYKFAPWIGRVLAELALQEGTVYDINRFNPARFVDQGITSHEPSIAEDPRPAPV